MASPPFLASSTGDSGRDVRIDDDLVFNFSGPIQAGSGFITISHGSSFSRSISINDASQVTISGNTLTVNPSFDLPYLDTFSVSFGDGVLQAPDGTPAFGSSVSFHVVPDPNDHTPPTLLSITPADNSTDVSIRPVFRLKFNELVEVDPNGGIKVYNSDGTFAFDAYYVPGSFPFTSDETVIVETPVLEPGKSYYITIDPGTITDRMGNAFAGITSPTALSFSTLPDYPTLQPGEPVNGQIAIAVRPIIDILFNKTIHAGTGNLKIYRSDGTLFESISLSDSSQVAINGQLLELRPNLKLAPGTSYYILLDAGAVVDDSGLGSLAVTSHTDIVFGTGADLSVAISAGQTVAANLTFGGSYRAFILNTGTMTNRQAGDSFLNNGAITVTSGVNNNNIIGVEFLPGVQSDSISKIENYGLISIDAASTNLVYGILQEAFGFGAPFVNGAAGRISVKGISASGYAAYDTGKSVLNAGSIEVNAGHSALGIDLHNANLDVTSGAPVNIVKSGSVTNTGSVSVNSQDGATSIGKYFSAIAINLGYGQLNNSGTISATAGSGTGYALGVRFNSFSGFTQQITNSGDISAPIAIFDDSIMSDVSQATNITNSGTIEGLIALGSGSDVLINTGTITGDIAMGAGADTLTNSGAITGDIALGAGNDTFNGAGGTLTGRIDAGTGEDKIYAGRGTYFIDGGDGTDTVAFSGASGSYSITTNGADTIVSSAGGTATIAHVENIAFSDKVLHPASSGLQINISYAASAANAPTGFKQAIANAVQYLEGLVYDPVTLNVQIEYGAVAGQSLDPGALGETSAAVLPFSYSQVLAALTADKKSQSDAAALSTLAANLSAILPSGNGWLYMTQAEAKALGLDGGGILYHPADVDGVIGFDSSNNVFDFNPADGISAGSYDFTALAIHELTHLLGRTTANGGAAGSRVQYMPLDLFHFSAPGVRTFSAAIPGYFSIDNGVTNLADFNSTPPGDPGDWAASVANNAFDAYAVPGVVLQVTQADLTEMDILGWDLNRLLLAGGSGDDTLTGGEGNDTFRGNGGTDVMDGHGGVDTVALALRPGNYYVTTTGNGYLVRGPGETDTLINIEQASFDGTGQTLSIADFAAQSFNPLLYVASYGDLIRGIGTNQTAAVTHYMTAGYYEGRSISFNALQYIASYSDLMRGFGTNQSAATTHYITAGYAEGRRASFDALQYVASYADLINGLGDNQSAAYTHYIQYGYAEGRRATFNALQYVASYADLIAGLGDNQTAADEHYIKYGFGEGRSATFSALQYVASYTDLIHGLGDNQTAAYEHYIKYGYGEGRTATFNALAYTASYADLMHGLGDNPTAAYEHYIKYGNAEGRTVSFDPVAYLLSYSDLQNAGLTAQTAAAHYIDFGFQEGRSASGAFGTEQTQHLLTLGTQAASSLTSGDKDWFSIDLTAGHIYDLSLSGLSGGVTGGLADPFLQLRNSHGVLVAQDNDSGPGTDALIHLTAATTGTFYLVASSNTPAATGNYKILAANG